MSLCICKIHFSERMTRGYIYCVSNPSYKSNIYKIGYTTMNLHNRINSLYKTGVPTKFVINFAKTVKRCREAEQDIHIKLKKLRINPSREFFNCPLATIKGIFEKVEGVWWEDGVERHKVITPTKRAKSKRTKLFRKVKQSKLNYKV